MSSWSSIKFSCCGLLGFTKYFSLSGFPSSCLCGVLYCYCCCYRRVFFCVSASCHFCLTFLLPEPDRLSTCRKFTYFSTFPGKIPNVLPFDKIYVITGASQSVTLLLHYFPITPQSLYVVLYIGSYQPKLSTNLYTYALIL